MLVMQNIKLIARLYKWNNRYRISHAFEYVNMIYTYLFCNINMLKIKIV